jgi:hypothetical protein
MVEIQQVEIQQHKIPKKTSRPVQPAGWKKALHWVTSGEYSIAL